jgi:hypothetical protein
MQVYLCISKFKYTGQPGLHAETNQLEFGNVKAHAIQPHNLVDDVRVFA